MHFHVIWLDGVYSHEPGRGGVEWCEDADLAEADAGSDPSDGEQLLLELNAAAVQGVALSGERAGQRDVRVGRGTRDEPFVKGPLCADLDGFRLLYWRHQLSSWLASNII
ncbi:MAG: hypothetical protein VCB25_07755 [Myxococcota bacterium]